MSSAHASLIPSHIPKDLRLPKPSDVPTSILEHGSPTENTKPLQDTLITSSASQGVPPSPPIPPSQEPQLYEPPPRNDPPSGQVKEELAVEVRPHSEVAAKPARVMDGNLRPASSARAAEPSSSADRPSASDNDNGPSQEGGTVRGKVDVRITNENLVVVAEEAKQLGHAEFGEKSQLGVTVAEPAEKAPVDMAPAPVLDEMIAPTNEGALNPAPQSTGRPNLNDPGSRGTEKGVQEDATAADHVVLEGVRTNGHERAKYARSDENCADSQVPADTVPADTVPTPELKEKLDHSEICATPSQPEPAESLEGTPNIPTVDRVKEESAKSPSQFTTGEQDPTATWPSTKTSEDATSRRVEPVAEAAEPAPISDTACGTMDKESEPTVPPHDQGEMKEQPERDIIVANKTKEAPPLAIDLENLTRSDAQSPDPTVTETERALSIEEEGGMTSTAPGLEAPIQHATNLQSPTSAEQPEGTLAQVAELTFTSPDPQTNANYPRVSLLEGTEATSPTQENVAALSPANTAPDLMGDSTSATLSEEPAVIVHPEPDGYKPKDIPEEGANHFIQPVLNAGPAQGEVKQEEAAEPTETGVY